jgi:nucleoside-diphosphate-sugar epimerase
LITGSRENLAEIAGDFEFIEADLNNEPELRKAVKGVDVVFHEAALPSVPRSVKDPVETHDACVNATFKLLVAAKEAGVKRFILRGIPVRPMAINKRFRRSRPCALKPLSPYAVAKLVGEYYCSVFNSVYGLQTFSLRYFNVFGPRQDPSSTYSGVISRFIDALMKGKQPLIYGDGEQTRDFTYIENVVDANIKAAQASEGFGETMNVANGERVSLNELLGVLKKLTDKEDIEARFEPERLGDVKHSQADNSRAVECLGYKKLVGLEEGLRRTIEWWRSSRFAN